MAEKIILRCTQCGVFVETNDSTMVQHLIKGLESFAVFYGSEVILIEVSDEKLSSGNRQLLEHLVTNQEQLRVIDKALAKGVLEIAADGRLRQLKGSKTLLAYFIGRLWAYDEIYIEKFSKEKCWKLCAQFPDKLVEQLFVEKGLRSLRKNRRDKPIPQGHELIDELFV